MIIQIYKTTCEDCGEELKSKVLHMTGSNEINVEFIEGMEFYCSDCEKTTFIELQKYTT